MNTKIAYALTSDYEDFFLEETMMSVFTVRHHNPRAHITLVTDTFTAETCREGMRHEFLALFDEVVVVDASAWDTKAKRSRYIKTSLRRHIKGDYLFIDSDTVICGDLSEIDNCPAPLAMVIDTHVPKARQDVLVTDYEIGLWGRDADTAEYYNSGVMLVRDVPETHRLYKRWHQLWIEAQASGVHLDQPPLHKAIAETGIDVHTLDGKWNCQLWGCFVAYLHSALIIHYSPNATGDMVTTLTDRALVQSVRSAGCICNDVAKVLLDPKNTFKPMLSVIKDDQVPFGRTGFYMDTLYLYKKHPAIFKTLDKVKKTFMWIAARTSER